VGTLKGRCPNHGGYKQGEELQVRAAQAHQLDQAAFEAVMDDDRIGKYIVRDGTRSGRPCGISTLTNDLGAVPLISPAYYAHRWPDYHRQQLIWYVGFLAVDPTTRERVRSPP
jgi:hypothetical protein